MRNTLYSQNISGIDVSSTALLRDTRSRSTSFSISSTKNFPSLYFILLPRLLGTEGIWLAMPAAEFTTLAIILASSRKRRCQL